MSSDLIHQSSVRNFIERFCQIQKYNIHINTFIDTICDFIQEGEKIAQTRPFSQKAMLWMDSLFTIIW